MEKASVGVKEQQGHGRLIDFKKIVIPNDEEEILDGETFTNWACDIVSNIIKHRKTNKNNKSFYKELNKYLLNLPPLKAMENLITIDNIINHQTSD